MKPDEANVLLWSLRWSVEDGDTLRWCVEYARVGPDPVAAAWAVAYEYQLMRALLLLCGHPRAADIPFACHGCVDGLATLAAPRDFCAGCCDAIRAVVPTLTIHEFFTGLSAAAPRRED